MLKLWRNNDNNGNNDNIRAEAKFDAGGGAESKYIGFDYDIAYNIRCFEFIE